MLGTSDVQLDTLGSQAIHDFVVKMRDREQSMLLFCILAAMPILLSPLLAVPAYITLSLTYSKRLTSLLVVSVVSEISL